jgi:hypothetical protein
MLAGKPSYSQLSAQLKSRYLGLCKVLFPFGVNTYLVIFKNYYFILPFCAATTGPSGTSQISPFDIRVL